MMSSEFPRLPDPDYQRGLKEATKDIFIEYRGFVILKMDGGFKWRDTWYETLPSTQLSIDAFIDSLSKITGVKTWEISIVKSDGSETILNDECKNQYLIGKSAYDRYRQQMVLNE